MCPCPPLPVFLLLFRVLLLFSSVLVSPVLAATYRQLHTFQGGTNHDGSEPAAAFIAVGNRLFGVTEYGNGSMLCPDIGGGCGTVFTLTTTGAEHVLYSFQGNAAHGVQDGYVPAANLTATAGGLVGTTYYGGDPGCLNHLGCGTVFALSQAGTETLLHTFAGPEGSNPDGAVLSLGGAMFGTTNSGGAYGNGTVFKLTAGGAYTVLHAFAGGADGANPVGNLIAFNGTLYGTTASGGSPGGCLQGCGTVYAITPSGLETVIYTFHGGLDGSSPSGGLIAVGNRLYGTTFEGGSNNAGTLFTLSLSGTLLARQAFTVTNGSWPSGSLIAIGDTLYGTTQRGGATLPPASAPNAGFGTIYSVAPGAPVTALYSFQGSNDGQWPTAGLVAIGGTLFGTTGFGGSGNGCSGTYGCGTAFAITP